MAPTRAFSFPLSHGEEASREHPFDIDHKDAAQLTSCEAFRCIRDLLECQNNNAFCPSHEDSNDREREAWLLQRDITFALIFPILEVYRNARRLALSMLGDRNIYDLELVFRGEGRGAFSWLQCFITIESEWCVAEGCPACLVSHILQSEPTIRMVITACRFASSVRRRKGDTHNIPIFDFYVSSLCRALREDSFYSRDSWKSFGDRAQTLERGIYTMAQQCCELERMSNTTSSESKRTSPASPIGSGSIQTLKTHRKINGKMTLVNDGYSWMQKIVLGCWTTLLADAQRHRGLKAAERKGAVGLSGPLSAIRSRSL